MPQIVLADTGIVYQNPMPHLRSRHAYFPTIVELPNGELLAAMDIGTAFEALDVRSYVCRSKDGGKTWTEPQLLFEPDESEYPVSTSCRIGKLADGTLLGWACCFNRSRRDCGLANPETEGFCETHYFTIRSTDSGQSWSAPKPVTLPVDWRHFEICAPPFALQDQRAMVVTAGFPDWDGRRPVGYGEGLAFLSEDDGESWNETTCVFGNRDQSLLSLEQAVTRLSDQRLLAMCWTINHQTGENGPNRMAFSSDGGQTFAPDLDSPLLGETCRPLGLDDNRLLVVYRRTDQRGFWAHLAQIEGEAWHRLDEQLLWGGEVTSHRTDVDSKFAQMSSLKFGCPAILRLQDGQIFVVFWCVEDNISVIRWFRLQVEK